MFQCPECEKEFDKQRGLDMHVRMSHKKEPEAKTLNPKPEIAKKPEKQTSETSTLSEMTPEQRAIHERAKKQDTKWFTIREDELNDFSLMANPFDLPPEAQKLQNEKRYAFRYCERKPDRIDQLTRSLEPPLRWALVTRNSLPVMSKYVDDLWGCVCKLDQVLLFKPWAHREMVKKAKDELADAVDASGSMKGRKQQIESSRDGVHVNAEEVKPEDSKYKIGSRDVVVADEGDVDKALGIEDDYTELGDLVVDE